MPGMFSELKKLDKDEAEVKNTTVASKFPQTPTVAIEPVKKLTEDSNCQLNAWITTHQDQLLNTSLYRLKANRVKIKKGELVGVAIEVLSRIIENLSPTQIDAAILDLYTNNKNEKI